MSSSSNSNDKKRSGESVGLEDSARRQQRPPAQSEEVGQSNNPETSASTLARYLKIGHSIDLLNLPDKTNDGYPALAVDAASGTGKTQQAFAFLAKGLQIVYLLGASATVGASQLIYSAMKNIVWEVDTIPEEVKRFVQAEDLTEEDMSIDALKGAIQALKSKPSHHKLNPKLIAIDFLTRKIYLCLIKKSEDGATVERAVSQEEEVENVPFENIAGDLRDKILFVDEAIPARQFQDKEGREGSLRFVRNIARALQMKAVMAGTASYLPNMMRASEFSRFHEAKTEWMKYCLYWQPVKVDALPKTIQNRDGWKGLNLTSVLQKHRPFLLRILEDLEGKHRNQQLGFLLRRAGMQLITKKSISPSNMFHWLSGAWLEGSRKVPSAFNTKAPDLVRGHFFEPGVTVISETTKPYLGRGIADINRMTGPRQLGVDRYTCIDKPWWSLTNLAPGGDTKQTKLNTSLTPSHSEILGSLTTCVQQCLVREPLLAVAMSFSHCLDPAGFNTSISEAISTCLSQHTVGSVSGEINEHICFAALQLASLQLIPARNYASVGVKRFLKSLFTYLNAQSHESSLSVDVIETMLEDWQDTGDKESTVPSSESLTDSLDIDKIDWKGVTVPLLIPASSVESLRKAALQCPALFGDMPIAGLIPGVTNARLDAKAYTWKEIGEGEETGDPCWNFEFKIFSNIYSLSKAKEDLTKKCSGTNGHALLIAFRPKGEAGLTVWWDGDYLRIAVVFQVAP